MGYDISLVVDTGGPEPHTISQYHETYNLAPVFKIIFEDSSGIKRLSGMRCNDALPLIARAANNLVLFLISNKVDGNPVITLAFLQEQCLLHPLARICID